MATTRTATARVAEPLSSHAAPETASASGTNQAAALSARRITGADSAAASRASRTIPAYVESAAVALARISSPPPALTLPLRTFSPQSWRTCTDSPVSADSSMIANSETTRPSTGSTSPEPTTSTSSTTIDSRAMTSKSSVMRRRAVRGTRSSSARRSLVARCSAAASRACPVASITPISAPARYCRTASAPASEITASTSTPNRPFRNPAITHHAAGTIAATVPAAQHASAICGAPANQAIPPAARTAPVTPSSTQREFIIM